MDALSGRCVLLGVTGGIAVYKACDLVSKLKKRGADVRVVLTENAARFVPPLTFETLSGNPCVSDMWARATTWEVEHISLAQRADLFLVAPCTANFIGKYAHGIADDMLTTTVLATRAPVLLCPAMNTGMYENPVVQENMEALARRGVRFVPPGEGLLACGDIGVGRLADVADIVSAAEHVLAETAMDREKAKASRAGSAAHAIAVGTYRGMRAAADDANASTNAVSTASPLPRRDLAGLHILVTAGPTREPIDPVRYLTNRSSGRMGYAIAEAARDRGARVTLLSGPVSLTPPTGVELVRMETTADLYREATERFPACDCAIQAAAPSDYRVATPAAQKIKKQGDAPGLTLELVETPDVAERLGEIATARQVLVAFAAETENVERNAVGKLARKNADLLVANDVTAPGAGFEVDTNVVTIYDRDGGAQALPQMRKRDVADALLDRVAACLRAKRGGAG